MHDGVKLESMGIPTAVVVLEGFKSLAMTKRRQMGLPDMEPVIVPGILGTRSTSYKKGEEAVGGVVDWITGSGDERGRAQ